MTQKIFFHDMFKFNHNLFQLLRKLKTLSKDGGSARRKLTGPLVELNRAMSTSLRHSSSISSLASMDKGNEGKHTITFLKMSRCM